MVGPLRGDAILPGVLVCLAVPIGCGGDDAEMVGETGSSGSTVASASTSTSTSNGTVGTSTDTSSGTTGTTDGTSGSDGGTGTTTGQDQPCNKNVVLMGYWPPSNEMLRPWSTDPEQNLGTWEGEDWGGLGYDVHAFFPEFPPDGNPFDDPFGSEGAIGSPESDLRVDYQDTSEDFWAIVDALQPVIVITTSRGGDLGWEIEAIEGGHDEGGANPAFDWTSDGFGPQTRPTESSVQPRTWDAISTYRNSNVLGSTLPLEAIEAAADALGSTSVAIDPDGTSGNYLSGFLGLHGVYYAEQYDHVVAAGHIHVGNALSTDSARALIEATLAAVLQAHPPDRVDCPPGG